MITCPNCGEQNPERFRLCGYCGTPLAPPSAAAEVRKTVTIIFSDLKGSTALGETLDSEALREVMRATSRRCAARWSAMAARSRSSSATR